MSETLPEPKKPKSGARKMGRIVLATAVAGGLVGVGGKLLNDFHNDRNDINQTSKIVAGVPGQIEGHYTKRLSIDPLRGASKELNYLEIEQCPADTAAVLEGKEPILAFNPALGVVNQTCNVDRVQVTPELYEAFRDGQVITFPGTPGENLER